MANEGDDSSKSPFSPNLEIKSVKHHVGSESITPLNRDKNFNFTVSALGVDDKGIERQ